MTLRTMTERQLVEAWEREEQRPFAGWDFSRLDGRMQTERPSWSYAVRAAALLRAATSAVDLGTGGGARFLELRDAWPHQVAVTEQVPANLALAAERLVPLGVRVVAARATDNDPLPFSDAEFDVVLNRHTAFNSNEVARILASDGRFLTQQVHGRSAEELQAAFGARPLWPDAAPEKYIPLLEAAAWR
jgi:SAM-dependent methyltransferase